MNGTGKEMMAYGSLVIPLTIAIAGMLFAMYLSKKHRSRTQVVESLPTCCGNSIHGMFICYQCDTIFTTAYCPGCNEPAAIPLVRLTGSLGGCNFKETVDAGYYAISTHLEKRKVEKIEAEKIEPVIEPEVVAEENFTRTLPPSQIEETTDVIS
jgi:hypothetical protein